MAFYDVIVRLCVCVGMLDNDNVKHFDDIWPKILFNDFFFLMLMLI